MTGRLRVGVWMVVAAGLISEARETDQFTTPRAPLYDIGPMLSRRVVELIEADRSGKVPEKVLAEWAGRSVVESRIAKWVKGIRVAEGEVAFRPRLAESVYGGARAPMPKAFKFDAPTVRVHGYYMGTDKLDHFFQQGNKYQRLAGRYEARGAEPAEAVAKVVEHGVGQEHGYYGTLVSGVYSNADLAANFAGMKFYMNLRHTVRIGEREMGPLFEWTGEGWRLRAGLDRERVLEPYFSNHLDESLNPSRYRYSRRSIQARIRERCGRWAAFYGDRVELVAPAGRSFAVSWFGEAYGYWLPAAAEVSIATECGERVRAGAGLP